MLHKLMVKYGLPLRFPHPCRYSELKPIPSPRGLPLIGTALSLLIAGSGPKVHLYVDARHRELGPIFRDKIGNVSAVFISDPDAIRSVFYNEGKYPAHVLPEPWIVYNKIHDCKRGLFFMEGEEWLCNRKKMNKVLLKSDTQWIQSCCMLATRNLTSALFADNEYIPNLESLLYKWSLEVIIAILVGDEAYRKDQHIYKEDIEKLANVVHLIFETTSKLTLIPANLALKLNLKKWQDFESVVTDALRLTKDLVNKIFQQKTISDGLVLKMMQQEMDKELIIKIITDFILAAGDTTTYSMQWILYLVSKHTDIQEKLYLEMSTDPLLLRNIVKESLRLYPVAPFLTRYLPEDLNTNGYIIPKDTLAILSIYTSGRDERYFKHPTVFMPDRWLRNQTINSKQMIQATMPFAIGTRSCIGRKIAEIQLQTGLSEIVKKYSMVLKNEKDIEMILKMVAVPGEPIKLKFIKRT